MSQEHWEDFFKKYGLYSIKLKLEVYEVDRSLDIDFHDVKKITIEELFQHFKNRHDWGTEHK